MDLARKRFENPSKIFHEVVRRKSVLQEELVNLIPKIIQEQDPPTAQTSRQENSADLSRFNAVQRDRYHFREIRRLRAEMRDMRDLLSDDDDDEPVILTSDDEDDDPNDQNGPDRRRVWIVNRPGRPIRPGQSIRPEQHIHPRQSSRSYSRFIKQEPNDQLVARIVVPDEGAVVRADAGHGVGEDNSNLLDRQMERARKRLQQQTQKKSSVQKKRRLDFDQKESQQQKRKASPLREVKVKDSKPGFQD